MMNFGRLPLVFLVAIALLAAGCSSGDSNSSTPTAAATASPTPAATEPTVAPPATPTPTPAGLTVRSTVVLVDVRSGTVKTLYDDADNAAYDARFVGDTVVIAAGTRTLAFNLDGSPASVPSAPPCQPAGQKPIYCTFSPDGRWVTYPVENGAKTLAPGYVVPLWDQWVMDVATGKAQMVQGGLIHCGGCDARYGPVWSPSSRYVAYAELGGEGGAGRRFLTDARTGATRQIGTGAEVTARPVWSPDGDRLLYEVVANEPLTRLADLAAGTSTDLSLAWPVAFDTTGTFIYSPAYGYSPKAPPPSTTIANATTGAVVATVAGAPPQSFGWSPGIAVAARSESFVAALQGAPGCDGTAIYSGAGSPAECRKGGEEGRVAPDGLHIAVARVTGSTGPATAPGASALTITRYAIDVVTTGGRTTTVVGDAASFQAPLMVWNAPGTYLLVLWPHATGL
jgi:hypothetical protein